MKKTIFLHIGMGKTGTTALQDFFWLNREVLRLQGITYPEYGTMANAHHLISPFVPADLRSRWEFKTVAEWSPMLLEADTDTILLSSELIAWTSSSDVVAFCNDVSRSFDLKVVIYLRRQDDMIMANYSQLVKAGSQRFDLERALEKQLSGFDYMKIIEPWATSVGKGNVIVRPYEKRQFYGGDICRDFMHHVFGIDTGEGFKFPDGDPNPRFSYAAMEYKLQLNRLFEDLEKSSGFNEVLLKYSAQPRSSAHKKYPIDSLISPAKREEILQRSLAVNQVIARDYLHREDGVLFDELDPAESGSWVKPQLTNTEARAISRFIQLNDSSAYEQLVSAVSQGTSSLRPMRTNAVKFFKQCIPSKSLLEARRRNFESENSQTTQKYGGAEDPLLVISVQFPLVLMKGYKALLERHFGSEFVGDYQDKPIGRSGPGRNWDALRKGLRFARQGAPLTSATCVHGHFLPLKFMLPSRGHRKRFVTWMRDPVERLVVNYMFWKGAVNQGPKGGLHQRMLEEDWSLETFCLHPEMQNIYSKFLWGFPLSRFDFIGIAELYETELQRFSLEILGCPLEDKWVEGGVPAGKAAIDPDLRSRIEDFHSSDIALYRRALKMREDKLGP